MASNLQEEIDPDLEEVYIRSRTEWLNPGDISNILAKREDLPTSTEPVQFPEEGLFLFNIVEQNVFDTLNWDLTKCKRFPDDDVDILYRVNQCLLVAIDEGVTSTYERRVYKYDIDYGTYRLVHYRSYHMSDSDAEEDSTGDDTDDSQNLGENDNDDNDDDDNDDDDSDDDDDNSGGDDDDDNEDDDSDDDDDNSGGDDDDDNDGDDSDDDDDNSGGDDNIEAVGSTPPLANGFCAATGIQKMKGKIPEFFGSQLCSQAEKDAIFTELQPHFLNLASNKYSVHFIQKMLDGASKQQLASCISSLRGHVAPLLRHMFGSVVVEHAYHLGTAAQKQELLAELYSTELQLFKGLTSTTEKKVVDIIAKLGLQTGDVNRHMTAIIQQILEKGIVDHTVEALRFPRTSLHGPSALNMQKDSCQEM